MAETQSTPPPHYEDEINLVELFAVLWSGKWLLGGIIVAAAVIAIIVSLMLPNVYRAEALLAPTDQESGGGLSALAAQYGGLASLAGLNLDSGGPDKTALGLEVLQSRKFLSEFIERHEILVPLIAAKGWNADSGELIIDADVYNAETEQWVRSVRAPKKPEPSAQEAYEQFTKNLFVHQDSASGFVTVAVQHYSPTVAKQWVDWLVDDLNSSIMLRDVTEAEQAIDYLHQQIASTSLADLQSVFFSLIEEQTKTVMLAKVSNEYLLATVDPAVVPEEKIKPRRSLIVAASTILGGLLGIAIVIFNNRRAL